MKFSWVIFSRIECRKKNNCGFLYLFKKNYPYFINLVEIGKHLLFNIFKVFQMICFATIFVRIILSSWAKFEVWLHASKIIDVACNNILLFLFSTKSSYYFYVICHHINFCFCFLKWILVVIILWSINNLTKSTIILFRSRNDK